MKRLSRLRAIAATARSCALSNYSIVGGYLRLSWFFGIFRRSIKLSQLTECHVRTWRNTFQFKDDPVERYEWTRIFLHCETGYAITLRVADLEGTLNEIKAHAPSIVVRHLTPIQRDIRIPKRRG